MNGINVLILIRYQSVFYVFLFIILYIGGSEMILDFCNLPTKMSAVVSLSLIAVISIIISAIPYILGRGHVNGLSIMLLLYFLDISLTLIGIFLMVIKSIEFDTLQMQLILFPVQLLLIYFCHYLMNSEMFSRTVLFFQTKRIVLEVNKMRKKINHKMQRVYYFFQKKELR